MKGLSLLWFVVRNRTINLPLPLKEEEIFFERLWKLRPLVGEIHLKFSVGAAGPKRKAASEKETASNA
jgi:hypothetical protein